MAAENILNCNFVVENICLQISVGWLMMTLVLVMQRWNTHTAITAIRSCVSVDMVSGQYAAIADTQLRLGKLATVISHTSSLLSLNAETKEET